MRYLVQAFLATLIAFVVSLVIKSWMEAPLINYGEVSGKALIQQEEAYFFNVPEAGSMVEFTLTGKTPDNDWSVFDIEVYGPDGNYLFTYFDELWSETGKDSDGFWRESKQYASLTQRFSQPGTYHAILSHADGRLNVKYLNLGIKVLNGDSRYIKLIFRVCMILTVVLLIAIVLYFDIWIKSVNTPYSSKPRSYRKPGLATKIKLFLWLLVIYSICITSAGYVGAKKKTADVDWAHIHGSQTTRDKSLLGTTSVAADFRGGAGRAGK